MTAVQQFYDDMADEYQFIFADWEKSVYRQAAILEAFLAKLGESAPKTVLDCACGIGTQAFALASKGYQVNATDLSPREIERAKDYAKRFDLPIPPTFAVADLLQSPVNSQKYAVVVAFDNVIAHFQNDDDLRQALATMQSQVSAGGLLALSIRDYDVLAQERPAHSGMTIADDGTGRRIVFQTWDWAEDGSSYQMEMFFSYQKGDTWQTKSYKSTLRAWQRADISRILAELGFEMINWQMPDESGFYQPVVTARNIAQ